MNRFLVISVVLICYALTLWGQATTSSVNGRVCDGHQEPLPGAAVVAIHEPSGTRYAAVTNIQGNFQIQGMRIGGPYRIEFSYVGYRRAVFTDIYLRLAENYVCDAQMKESAELDEIIVLGTTSKFAGTKTGAVTHITSDNIFSFPNIDRGLNSLTKMSPYSNGAGFGGRDQRMNNYTIDGANFNYSMGLDGVVLPGGGNPISIDALQEIQVSIAPYDLRQSNFIGGSVNAVTKSGTNSYRGSAYMYTKNEYLRGNKVDDFDLGTRETERRNIYGFTFGGPIIKNKLFFFVNAECENAPQPIHKWKLSEDGVEDVQNLVSRVTAKDMERFSNDLKNMYGYNTGSWTDFSGSTDVYRAMARIDWNIASQHRLMIRYNYTGQEKDNNLVGPALGINGGPVSRYSMSFRNSTWKQLDNVNSLTAELNSRFRDNISNQFLASYTINDGNKRECNGDFPTVDIMKPDDSDPKINRAFMNAGYDQHAWRNGIKERVWSITDNLSIQLGSHSLLLGTSFESQNVSNCYMRYGAGYYRYNSYEDFVNKAAPVAFALSYSLTGEDEALADVHYNQFSLYAQDEYNVNARLKLLYGIRMDLPLYVNKRYENPSIASYEFNGEKLSTAQWPKAMPLFSPRIGFNYDLSGDQTLKLRGGTGIFTGRFPLVFLSKMQEGSGMLTTTVSTQVAGDELLAALAGGIRTPKQVLSEIAPKFPGRFPTEPGAVDKIITIDRKFKMPQVWKTSLAFDWRLPLPFRSDFTLEAIYIKDINAIQQRNVNMISLDDPLMSRLSGGDDRYVYPGVQNKENLNLIHKKISYAMLMSNTHKGYSYNLNATLHMEPVRGMNLMAAYTYTKSRTLTNNASNQVENAWQQEPSVQGANYLTMHNASYMFSPHRVIASASYTKEYAKVFATSISLFYTGQRNGSYSYLIDGDINKDGTLYDLMYIPATRGELNFQDMTIKDGRVFSAAEQRDAFWAFVEQDPYLKKRKGKYAETNGAYQPWLNRLDLRVVQDFKVKVGKSINTLQLSVDILNVGNLLNSAWGVAKTVSTNKLLQYKGLNEKNEPIYTMTTLTEDGTTILPYRSFVPSRISSNCWQLQFGIRYIFN